MRNVMIGLGLLVACATMGSCLISVARADVDTSSGLIMPVGCEHYDEKDNVTDPGRCFYACSSNSIQLSDHMINQNVVRFATHCASYYQDADVEAQLPLAPGALTLSFWESRSYYSEAVLDPRRDNQPPTCGSSPLPGCYDPIPLGHWRELHAGQSVSFEVVVSEPDLLDGYRVGFVEPGVPALACPADLDGDGFVGGGDAGLFWAEAFGKICPAYGAPYATAPTAQ